jgi:hypothetical protein
MSSRERWTVYPLLFLTLGIALTDKVTRQVNTDNVVCKSLLVTDRLGKTEVVVASTGDGGFVQTRGGTRSPDVIVGHYQDWSGLLFADAKGNVVVRPGLAFPSPPRKPAGGATMLKKDDKRPSPRRTAPERSEE